MEATIVERDALEQRARPGGEGLRMLRLRRGLSTRMVASLSRGIALSRGNDEFAISHTRLAQIENQGSIPSIFKLYTLSAVYSVKLTALLDFYFSIGDLADLQLSLNSDHTHLVAGEEDNLTATGPRQQMRPLEFRDSTTLLAPGHCAQEASLLTLLNATSNTCSRYGWIGLNDYTMYPLLRPGTFVQIAECTTVAKPMQYSNELERPIYFLELRTGYVASWCEMRGKRLISIPHSLSPCGIREFALPTEAEVVGRISGVAIRLSNE